MSDSDDKYVEKRIRYRYYGPLPSKSPLLVRVPGVKGSRRRLHVVAAEAMTRLAEAIKRDLDIELQLASAWRRHRWKSREHYEQTVIKRFGSIREGRKWLAYKSPHETGLAMDIGVGGLWPSKKTRKAQREQPLHKWLVEHAYEFGWHPYKREPWHWEHPVSLDAFKSGTLGPDDPGPPDDDDFSFEPGDEEDEELVEVDDLEEFPEGEPEDEEAEVNDA
ncbi:MAG: D-alanyl-D-alanine carboxypeptidase family protein [Myxococcota bacterium]